MKEKIDFKITTPDIKKLEEQSINLENLNQEAENTITSEGKNEVFERIDFLEKEMDNMESKLGLPKEQVLNLYESINKEEATEELFIAIKDAPQDVREDFFNGSVSRVLDWLAQKAISNKSKLAKIVASLFIFTIGMVGTLQIEKKAYAEDGKKITSQVKNDFQKESKQLDELKKQYTEIADNVAGHSIKNSNKEFITDFNWKNFILDVSKEQEKSIYEFKKIFKLIWGENFSADVKFLESEKMKSSHNFIPSGLYSPEGDVIKLNADVFKKINFLQEISNTELDNRHILKIYDLLFHESGHANQHWGHADFLSKISEETGIKESVFFNIIKNSKILSKEKKEVMQEKVYVNEMINESYASFAEVYGGIKFAENFDFPIEEYLAQSSFFNKIVEANEQKEFYGHKLLNRSTYLGVEFFSILLMDEFNYDLNQVKSFFKNSSEKEIAIKIVDAFNNFQAKKGKKMNMDIKSQSPRELYQALLEDKADKILLEEREAVSGMFSKFAENLAKQNDFNDGLLQKKIKELNREDIFSWVATYAYDEFSSLEKYSKDELSIEILFEEKELLKIISDVYLYAFNWSEEKRIEDLRIKIDQTKIKLKKYSAKKEFVYLTSRIEDEMNNLEEIYKNYNTKKIGGFKHRN